jgi:hypothetical protein
VSSEINPPAAASDPKRANNDTSQNVFRNGDHFTSRPVPSVAAPRGVPVRLRAALPPIPSFLCGFLFQLPFLLPAVPSARTRSSESAMPRLTESWRRSTEPAARRRCPLSGELVRPESAAGRPSAESLAEIPELLEELVAARPTAFVNFHQHPASRPVMTAIMFVFWTGHLGIWIICLFPI